MECCFGALLFILQTTEMIDTKVWKLDILDILKKKITKQVRPKNMKFFVNELMKTNKCG